MWQRTEKYNIEAIEKLICGMCMSIHAMSQTCHYPDGLVPITQGIMKFGSLIIGII